MSGRRLPIALGAIVMLLLTAQVTSAAPTLTSQVTGVFNSAAAKGIIVINGFGDGSVKVAVSIPGLPTGQDFRLVGSARPCRLSNASRAELFAIIINDSEPFDVVAVDGFKTNNLFSIRLFRTGGSTAQIACTKATYLEPAPR
jgi:hypothetical protein